MHFMDFSGYEGAVLGLVATYFRHGSNIMLYPRSANRVDYERMIRSLTERSRLVAHTIIAILNDKSLPQCRNYHFHEILLAARAFISWADNSKRGEADEKR